jgi:hypothetical protein
MSLYQAVTSFIVWIILLMTKLNLVVPAVLAVSMAVTVQARMTTGNDLMQHCSNTTDSFCAGYIAGVIDTSHALFCIPPDVSKLEILNITIMYLKQHPKKLGLYAPNLVVKSIRSAFPCKDGR